MTISRVGISCLPGRGHLYPSVALGLRLADRGYEVTIFALPIGRSIVRDAGLNFRSIESCKPNEDSARRSHRNEHSPRTLDVISHQSRAVFSQLGDAVRECKIQALMVDQADLASGTVADRLGIPFVNVSFFPPVYLDDEVPPFICGWMPSDAPNIRARNRRANQLLRRLVDPALQEINEERRFWKLALFQDLNDAFSQHAIITQLPRFLDFPRSRQPSHIHHTGPFVDRRARRSVPFPWQSLTKGEFLYACMGTVRNNVRRTFETIALACARLNLQLVISLGGMALTPEDLGELAGDPIVVHYAPQDAVLEKASAAITHGGLNSTLECLSYAVPSVAIPVTDDQPGVSARLEWGGFGLSIPSRRLTISNLGHCIETVLNDSRYRLATREAASVLSRMRGTEEAVHIFEATLGRC